MRIGVPVVLLLLASVVAGCASQDLAEWKSHPTHFASGDHMVFSLKNQGKTPKVTSADTRVATAESWWGSPVVVRADQIFQN